jgi:hypothetical protein
VGGKHQVLVRRQHGIGHAAGIARLVVAGGR